MAQKPETVFRTKKVEPFLKALKYTHNFSIQQQTINGTPDKLVCSNGRFVGLEIKDDEGELSRRQLYELEQIELKGGVALVACPKNWDRVKLILLQLDQGGQHNDQDYQWRDF